MKAHEFDEKFDRGESIIADLDLSTLRQPAYETKKVNVDFPQWMVTSLDHEARRLGVTRQSIIKMWIARQLDHREHSYT